MVKIVTNGTTLPPKIVTKIIDSGINYIEVSLDGFDGEIKKNIEDQMRTKSLLLKRYIKPK